MDLIDKAKKTLRLAADMSRDYYGDKLIVCYSGGKDSDVLLHLAESCLTPDDFEVINSHTTVDAPPTVYHTMEQFERLNGGGIKTTIKKPIWQSTNKGSEYRKNLTGKQITMWNLIPYNKMPPTMLLRYCCKYLKETTTPNRLIAVGTRADESPRRKGRDSFAVRGETKKDAKYFSLDHTEEVYHESLDRDPIWDCTLIKTMREHKDTIASPIYEWTDNDIWQYIKDNNIETNPMYEHGYYRVGCIGCPMAKYHIKMQGFKDFPKYKDAYMRAFERMIEERNKSGVDTKWANGQEVFDWWVGTYNRTIRGQMTLEDYMNV